MNKLLISLLSLTGIAGIGTGGYFLLRNSTENVAQQGDNQVNGKDQKEEEQTANDKSTGGQSTGAEPGTSQNSETQPQSPVS